MDFNKLEWIVSALEIIEKGRVLPRVLYGATLAALLFGLGSLGNLFTGLAALVK